MSPLPGHCGIVNRGNICSVITVVHFLSELNHWRVLRPGNNPFYIQPIPIFWQMNQNQVRYPGALMTLIQQTTNLFPPNVNHMAGDVLMFLLDPNHGRVDTVPGSLVQVANRHRCQSCTLTNTTPFSYVLRIAISDSPVPINLDQLVNDRLANPLVFDCTSCQASQQVQDTILTARGTGRLGGRFLILSLIHI